MSNEFVYSSDYNVDNGKFLCRLPFIDSSVYLHLTRGKSSKTNLTPKNSNFRREN